MTFKFIITPSLAKQLDKLAHRDKVLATAVRKKIVQIIDGDGIFLDHLKNLRHDFSKYKRVQVGSFVLTFSVKGSTIIFERFEHHDEIYKRG